MKPEYRANLNALKGDTRLDYAIKSVGLASRDAAVARSSGLGEAIVQRRERIKAKRAKVKASRKHRLATL